MSVAIKGLFQIRKKFEDIKVVIISCKSKDRQHKDKQKKDRQHKDQQKKDRQHKDKQKKDGRTHNDLQTITENNKDRATRNPLKTRMLRKGKKFLLHMWHPSCYSCYKPGDKS